MSQHHDELARRLAAIVASSDDAIVSKDLNGIVLSWNDAAERIFGYTAAEMIGTSIRRIIPDNRQSEEDAVLEAIRAGRRIDHFETQRKTRDGHLIPISLTVSPVLDATGKVIGASKIARDISDRKRAEDHASRTAQRDAFLAEVTLTLTRSLDYEQTLRTLAVAATPALADYCAVDVVDEDGDLKRLAVIHVDPAKAQLAQQVRAKFEGRETASSAQTVARTGVSSFIPDITDDMLVTAAQGDDQRVEMLRSLGLVSYMSVPMVAHERSVGVLSLANAESRRRFTRDDLRLAEDVASRAALAIENAQSYRQLHHANRLKDEFLATLSHELRTPLNAVLGYARMLQSGAVPEEKIPQALEVIDRNAAALAQMVEDVLDVSRIVLGKTRLRVQPTDIAGVVQDALATVRPAVDAKGLHLTCAIPEHMSDVPGDPHRLQQVVWNLLSNAAKFTPPGGHIDVRVVDTDAIVQIIVSDTGVGFPKAFKPHLFERFRQAESGTTRLHGGLGLGLSIARHIIEMHGGTIDAESAGEGKGATFTVTLPSTRVSAKSRSA
ncbi:MAG: PAS domain S-box protein [Acidobacteria bacterium]|nr:MAG: PAS domain S-box protein [Acidobacteriota bacterium]